MTKFSDQLYRITYPITGTRVTFDVNKVGDHHKVRRLMVDTIAEFYECVPTRDQLGRKTNCSEHPRADWDPDEDVCSEVLELAKWMADALFGETRDDQDRPSFCDRHEVRQHRDGKPPWCPHCGLTAAGEKPVSIIIQKVAGR